jgi:hypothetical protein
MKLKFAYMILTVILACSLVANAFLYLQHDNLTNNGFQLQVSSLENQAANLQEENVNLQNQIQNRLNQMPTAQLATRLGTKDIRSPPYPNHPWGGIRFYVSGEVWNVGGAAANNTKLHIILYQGSVKANDTYVELGRVEAGSFVDVAANIRYVGDALTNWVIIPEYS